VPAQSPAGKSGSELRCKHEAATPDLYFSQPARWNKKTSLHSSMQLNEESAMSMSLAGYLYVRVYPARKKGNTTVFGLPLKIVAMRQLRVFLRRR
jgi:hypothetical protein